MTVAGYVNQTFAKCIVAITAVMASSLVAGAAESLTAVERQTVHTAIGVESFVVQDVVMAASPNGYTAANVVLAGEMAKVMLSPYSLRGPDFKAVARGAGGTLTDIDTGGPATYRGFIESMPGTEVAATLRNGTMTAWIHTPGDIWVVQPLSDVLGGDRGAGHVIYQAADVLPADVTCGTEGALFDGVDFGVAGTVAGGDSECDIAIAQIAFDTDFEYFVACGSDEEAAIADIESILNAMDLIYARDVGITYEVTRIIVQIDVDDPYDATNFSTALNEFGDHWNDAHSPQNPDAVDPIEYDVAHFMTGKANRGVIGVAWLGVICNLDLAYGLSYSKWTTNFLQRVGVTTHELGHNWGSGHCNSAEDCKIMCASISGCTGDISGFGPDSIAVIELFRDSRTCLDGAPTLPTNAKLYGISDGVPDGEPSDEFGISVDIDDFFAVVGAWGDDHLNLPGLDDQFDAGSAYIYVRSGETWVEDVKLVPNFYDPDTGDDGLEGNDRFGVSVSVSGKFALIGAHRDDGEFNSTRGSGAAYVFHEVGPSDWMQEAILRAEDVGRADEFGTSVAISIDGPNQAWAIIGAPLADIEGTIDAGAAYVFRFEDNVWTQHQKLTAEAPADFEEFGTSVSIGYDSDLGRVVAVVGAPAVDTKMNDDTGAVSVFALDTADPLPQMFELEAVFQEFPAKGDDNQEFGISVDLDIADSGETIIVGAHGADVDGVSDSGRAFIYRFNDDEKNPIWSFDAMLVASDGANFDYYGQSVAIHDGRAVVGAWLADVQGFNSGAVYFSEYDDQNEFWEQTIKIIPHDGASSHWFGNAVDVTDLFIVVGAIGDDVQSSNSGAAYVYSTDLTDLTFDDCNENGVSDACDIVDGTSTDCNENDVPDECDIAADPSLDVDPENGVIDTCEDCNMNGVPDDDEIEGNDCNVNGRLDECDIASGESLDANGDMIPDECAIDCNENGIPDLMDLADGSSLDCNGNSVPDECEIDADPDCNTNGVLDFCDILSGTSTDFDLNGIPDECDPDCDQDGLPDGYEIEFEFEMDCNENLIPDNCDIAGGLSDDDNGNGIPDECEGFCAGDSNDDGMIGILDLTALLGDWGICVGCPSDLNDDGMVNNLDLLQLLGSWGPCTPG